MVVDIYYTYDFLFIIFYFSDLKNKHLYHVCREKVKSVRENFGNWFNYEFMDQFYP